MSALALLIPLALLVAAQVTARQHRASLHLPPDPPIHVRRSPR